MSNDLSNVNVIIRNLSSLFFVIWYNFYFFSDKYVKCCIRLSIELILLYITDKYIMVGPDIEDLTE